MSLRDFKPEQSSVKFRDGSFTVRGLTLDDVSILVRTHLPDLDKMANLYVGVGKDIFARLAQDQFLMALLRDAPALSANIIAVAADDPDAAEDFARRLPLPVQVNALLEIGRLTFEDFGGPKPFLALIKTMLPEVTSAAGAADARERAAP